MRGDVKGFSLPEVLVGLAILGISTTMVLSVVDLQIKGSGKLQKTMRMYEIYYENINELKGYTAAQLPSVDTCWVKKYSTDASLIQITKDLSATSADCEGKNIDPGAIVIIWTSRSASQTQAVFTPADSLKLPIYADSLVELKMDGYSTELSSNPEKVSMSVFKN